MGLEQSERRMIIISVGLGLIYIATILIIIGLTTNNWKAIWDDNYHNRRIEVEFGLHRVCFRDADKCTNPYSNFDQSNYLPKVQALAIVGGFMSLFSTIFSMVNLASDRLGWSHVGIVAPATVCALLGGLFEMVACILFSEKVEITNEYISFYRTIRLGWSFGLVCVAVAFLYIGGVMMAVSGLSKPGPKYMMPPPPAYPGPGSIASPGPGSVMSYPGSRISSKRGW